MAARKHTEDPTAAIHAVRSYDDKLGIETVDGSQTTMRTPVHSPVGGFRTFPFSWRRMFRSTFRGRCPDCGKGEIFLGFLRIRNVCEVCRVRFERDSGSFLGPTTLAYVVAIVVEAVLFAVLVWKWGLFPGLEYALIAGAVVAVAGSYRFLKGWWIWLLWTSELVYADPDESEVDSTPAIEAP
jgi:uncharacterized protein (DUF983 family)